MEQQIQQFKQFLTRLPHAKLSALVTLLVVVYLAFLLSKLVWLVWPKPVISPLAPAQHTSQSNNVRNSSAQHIIEQFLFGKAIVTNNNNTAQQSQVVNNAPETRLSINLTGIVAVSNDDQGGVAIIESQGKQVSYLAEDVIQGTRAKVAQILPDRVILNVSGRFETLMLDEIDFQKIEDENKDIIIHYNPNFNEGLIGIIAARLKDYFNKPSIVITNSSESLKGSARSVYNYNIGRVIKNLFDKNIIIAGGGHNMAAGFTLKKNNLNHFQDYILKDFFDTGTLKNNIFSYDAEVSTLAFNENFYNDIKKLEPFGTGNTVPTFLFKDLKIINTKILNKKHISLIFKSKTGFLINSISFNSADNKIGEYLLNYKNTLNVLGQINENIWNNKKTLQLTIRDVIL